MYCVRGMFCLSLRVVLNVERMFYEFSTRFDINTEFRWMFYNNVLSAIGGRRLIYYGSNCELDLVRR